MIDIVLATYNGQKFLAEQIKSIQLNHGYQQWINRIIISDDGSTDQSQEIVVALSKQDAKITWVTNSSYKTGPKFNFAFGLTQSKADYIMLCDQDDIWLPDKVEKSIQALKNAEKELSAETPILVFSDQQIVAENLQEICTSYFLLKKITKDWYLKFEQLSQQNVVSGCTVLCNRALINKALPIPDKAYMHDWWLAMVASRCGHIEFIDQPLMQYRQHGQNTIGANQRTRLDLFKRFFYHLQQFENSIKSIILQAQAFQTFELENNLSPNKTIEALATLQYQTRSQRLKLFVNKTITRSNIAGRFALLIVLLKMKTDGTTVSR